MPCLLLASSPRVTGLSRDALFGIQMPFDLPTCTFPTLPSPRTTLTVYAAAQTRRSSS